MTSRFHSIGLGLSFLAAYILLDWISFLYEFSPWGFTPWNPQSGLSLAFLLRTSPASWLWLPPAVFLADLTVRSPAASVELAAASAIVLAGGYASAALALRRALDFDAALATPKDCVKLVAVAGAVSLAVSLLYAGIYAAAGHVPWVDFAAAAFRHWVGDIIGIAVFAPLFLRFPRPGTAGAVVSADWREIAAQAASVMVCLWLVFLPQTDEFKFFYLLFLPVIWSAIRFGLDGAVITIGVTQLGLIGAVQIRGFGPEPVVEFQVLMLAIAFTGILVGSVVEERQRVQSDLRRSEERLREHQAELAHFSRSSAVGEMAASLAHELSQPLAATTTYLGACGRLLRSSTVELALIREAISKAEIQARRAGQVLAGLRDFLYRGETNLTPIPAERLVASVVDLARGEIERIGATLDFSDDAKDAAILVDRIQLEQALLNLVRNAVEALAESPGGQRRLILRVHSDDENVVLSVGDTGPGIAPEIADRLFQPFASTKPSGMGLGLTITRSIVEAHGGSLQMESGVSGGVTFQIRLPRVPQT